MAETSARRSGMGRMGGVVISTDGERFDVPAWDGDRCEHNSLVHMQPCSNPLPRGTHQWTCTSAIKIAKFDLHLLRHNHDLA